MDFCCRQYRIVTFLNGRFVPEEGGFPTSMDLKDDEDDSKDAEEKHSKSAIPPVIHI